MLNIFFSVVENVLIKDYFDYYLTYVKALRLKCKEQVKNDDISSEFSLLSYFIMRFEKLFWTE
jgi:hypothetical protein